MGFKGISTMSSVTREDSSGVLGRPDDRPGSEAPGGKGWLSEERLGVALVVAGTVLLVSGVVQPGQGDGFDRLALALGLLVLPQGLQRVASGRGHTRVAGRLNVLTRLGVLAGVLLVWGGLIADWAAGRGTNWLVLLAGVFLLAGALLTAAGEISRRRSTRAGTSARMGA